MTKITPWFNQEELDKMIENFKSVSDCPYVEELIGLTPEEVLNHEDAPQWAYLYVKNFLKKRDESFEGIIKKCPMYSYDYVKNFLKKREKSFEESIRQDYCYWKKYQKEFLTA